MTDTATPNRKIHQGRNVKRFREMLGIKQDALAYELGEDWNQKKISLLEQKETIESDVLSRVAKILKVPTEAIENFDEDSAINIIANTFHDSAVANTFTDGAQANFNCTFNPLDKMVELYERMLQQQKEMIEKLEKLIQGK
ncbi:helix-turn-helix domain-containing protein [Elizabethkingia anophelis]|uniref:helix-turn-helix transcriptional regulator n=1 Tax=Elizabethkingia anophelis TaxID=1117645 RepID=UPI001625DF2B|nr:helix-turn-helix transcriptional regulator [Elizabethkingia anophelis]MCT4322292.1 helix-turn-helix transcriptional regulator [Elizabethkingia anophelis]HAY3535356.1 helix-turn-helix transcriptional regulator [Elizabethkingia anophelis]HAY3537366.1 helix-turn-helix transcriptional regulator [Elizabethkingia anophelis]HAY3547472.1 helix-turn-helix transcriptional regulator [Elizabethkingia anophelis]HAY3549280.1 helix-turn-helix transcriptional regulator [Elizabethkingia anophelis]